MGLTQAQKSLLEKARSVGASDFAVSLSDETCCYLVAVIVNDLGLNKSFPELPKSVKPFFGNESLDALVLGGHDFQALAEKLLKIDPNADTYISCLATLHKSRLKYARILERQALPTMDQVGPRGLLQYGSMSPRALIGLMLWRKWIFDIDNRAGQETGYLFEPIIAHSIGGVPVSAKKSPVRRREDQKKGRQIDCLKEKRAYEIKLRVTIAASGQGRWQEELDFPADAMASGFKPVLIIFDPTANEKQDALKKVFLACRGEVYVGAKAWEHLDAMAGKTMSKFLDRYVREPMQALLNEIPSGGGLPDITLKMTDTELSIDVNGEKWTTRRAAVQDEVSKDPKIPDDVDDE